MLSELFIGTCRDQNVTCRAGSFSACRTLEFALSLMVNTFTHWAILLVYVRKTILFYFKDSVTSQFMTAWNPFFPYKANFIQNILYLHALVYFFYNDLIPFKKMLTCCLWLWNKRSYRLLLHVRGATSAKLSFLPKVTELGIRLGSVSHLRFFSHVA